MKTKLSKARHGFTLVEIMVVLMIISIMGGMVLAAIGNVTTTAKLARTKTILAAVDAVIQEQYDSYQHRPLPVEIPDLFNPSSRGPVEVGLEVLPDELARVRLMMIRDLQRMEMPDRFGDIIAGPSALSAMASPVVVDPSTNEIVSVRNDYTRRKRLSVGWYGSGRPGATARELSDNVPSKLAAYRDRAQVRDSVTGNIFTLSQALSSGNAALVDRVLENQSAECLYLIVATTFLGGTPAIDAIPATSIGDTDDDGLLEILDGWDEPLAFIRWPTGYTDIRKTLSERLVEYQTADTFDGFQSDFAYYVPDSVSPIAWPLETDPEIVTPMLQNRTKPWSMRPLILSAGDDGEFGITLDPVTSAGIRLPGFTVTHTDWNWPATVPYMGELSLGAQGVPPSIGIPYPDPYLRVFVNKNGGAGGSFTGLLPGQFSGPDAADLVPDNVSSYQLQEDQ